MGFLRTNKSPNARAVDALVDGQPLLAVMRDAADDIARQAVREALAEFSDGPAALLITCLLESATAGWLSLGAAVEAAPRLSRPRADWVSARMAKYSRFLNSDEPTQHLINLVLSVTGLH